MSKFAKRQPLTPTAPIVTTGVPTLTHEGGHGVARDPKSELFLLAVTNMVSERTFYESAKSRDARFVALIHEVTHTDPTWVQSFVPFLRDTANMRSASLVVAAEYVNAGGPNGRWTVQAACQRADEPAELLAYWTTTYGRKLPAAIKRGVADAVRRLYNERAALRYDGIGSPWRMADVIELVHPTPVAPWQSALFRYLLDKRHHDDGDDRIEELLGNIWADRALNRQPIEARRAMLGAAIEAGWSWERLSGWLPGGMDREAWEAVIPNMGYMALLRNLRNFDEAGIGDDIAAQVMATLQDPATVARSRQFPFRFYSAYKEIGSLRWAPALERALDASLARVPILAGKTLILVDLSGSMYQRMSGRSKRERWELAALFGVALGKRAEHASLVAFGSGSDDRTAVLRKPTLAAVDDFKGSLGGTNTFTALMNHYNGQDRIVILTDEQAHDAGTYTLPDVPIYTFNLAGYRPAHLESGVRNRYAFGGLNDAAFLTLPLLEAHRDGRWPWDAEVR